MEGFTVVKEGVYRHELLGLFATEAEAVSRGLEACAAEEDDYHAFFVLKLDGSGEKVIGGVRRADRKQRVEVWESAAQEWKPTIVHPHPARYEVY
jgi:hypothetical protein